MAPAAALAKFVKAPAAATNGHLNMASLIVQNWLRRPVG
jgi:hypothetical protein